MSGIKVGDIVERTAASWKGCIQGDHYEVTGLIPKNNCITLKGITDDFADHKFKVIREAVVSSEDFREEELLKMEKERDMVQKSRDDAEAKILLADYKLEYIENSIEFLLKDM